MSLHSLETCDLLTGRRCGRDVLSPLGEQALKEGPQRTRARAAAQAASASKPRAFPRPCLGWTRSGLPHTRVQPEMAQRPHQGRGMNGRTPISAFLGGISGQSSAR